MDIAVTKVPENGYKENKNKNQQNSIGNSVISLEATSSLVGKSGRNQSTNAFLFFFSESLREQAVEMHDSNRDFLTPA